MVDLSTGAPGDSPATLSRYGQMIQSFDEYDQIDHEFSNQGDYDDWTHHVKYLYQERDGGYDGLGRLIKKNYRLGVAGESSALGFANYIYDGARRVQEILRYPVAAAALLWPAAADRPPLHAHAECAAGGGCPPGYATQHVIEHEYVWSPDGGDSIVAAITPDDLYGFDDDGPPAGAGLPSVAGSGDDDVYYMLQDD
ncbi:MAG: hypothetical protein SF069_11190, partial [Phycisphaerae bacterium]|nr:hypothetical protein [Phycisphaerae bacterium]